MGFYPPLEELLTKPTKSKLMVLHRSFRSSIGLLILFLLLVAGVVALALETLGNGSNSQAGWGFLLRLSALLPLCVMLEILRRYLNDLYVIGRDKITHYQGRVSLKLATPSIRNIDLRAITVSQGILGRMLDFGEVALATAAQEGPEIILRGVRSPHELAKLIDELRQKSQRATFESATNEQNFTEAIQND